MTTRRMETLAQRALWLIVMSLLFAAKGTHGVQSVPPAEKQTSPEKDAQAKWLEKLPKDDRVALDAVIGQPPASLTNDLKWVNGRPATWEQLQGKVVVVQSWTSANAVGRKWPERLCAAVSDVAPDDVRLIALHTPEGADNAETFSQRQELCGNASVVIDPSGAFCDSLGMYKRPTNVVVDRAGTVRFAGLTTAGTRAAVEMLLAEPYEPAKRGENSKSKQPPPSADFPPINGNVSSATDIRGKAAPDLFVSEWITKAPNVTGKVVVIDFWATWCGPCIAAIPHMNELAEKFANDVVCIGISDEKRTDFEGGLRKRNLNANSFKYALALDNSRKMSSVINIRGIPHCIVMSQDWIVRWQGHPAGLTAPTLEQIVKANAKVSPSGSRNAPKRRGWTTGS